MQSKVRFPSLRQSFLQGGNIYLSRGQLGFDNHFGGGIGKLTVYTLGTLVSNRR